MEQCDALLWLIAWVYDSFGFDVVNRVKAGLGILSTVVQKSFTSQYIESEDYINDTIRAIMEDFDFRGWKQRISVFAWNINETINRLPKQSAINCMLMNLNHKYINTFLTFYGKQQIRGGVF